MQHAVAFLLCGQVLTGVCGLPLHPAAFPRVRDRQPSQCVVEMEDTPAATHTTVSVSNLQLGQGTLLRLAALLRVGGAAGAGAESEHEEQQQQLFEAAQHPEGAGGLWDAEELHSSPSFPVWDDLPAEVTPPSTGIDEAAAAAGAAAGGPERMQQDEPAAPPPPAAATAAAAMVNQPGSTPQPAPPPPPPPGKAVITDVRLQDCRLLWKYQPDVAPLRGSLAAVHDALSLHEDLLSLEVPLLMLRLPVEPGSNAAAPALPGREAPGSSSTGSRLAEEEQPWRPSAASGPEGGRPVPPLVSAVGIKLSAAVVGFSAHSMLPLLMLPGLQLTSTYEGGAKSTSGSTGGGGSIARDLASAALAVHSLSISALELGAHPSHMRMLAAAWQLAQDEMEVLSREPPEPTTDSSSATSVSGLPESTATASAAAAPAAAALPAARAASTLPPSAGASQAVLGVGPVGGPAWAPGTPWRLEASVGLVGLSLLGSTASSSCLKLEWVGLQGSYSSQSAQAEGGQEVRLGWDHATLHLLQPRPALRPSDYTPFGAPPPMSRWVVVA